MGWVIVIVTFNAEKYIRQCLASIKATEEHVEVVIVDNASTDATIELVREFDCELISLSQNIGFGKANNIGIKFGLEHTNASSYLLLNQDAYLREDFFRSFRELPHQVSNSVVAALQLNGAGTELDKKSEEFYLEPRSCPGFLADAYFDRLRSYYPIEFMNAAAWVIPVGIIKLVGGFNPSFFHYGEDKNYVDRLHFHGEKLYLAPNCVVFHDRDLRSSTNYDKALFKESLKLLINFSQPQSGHRWVEFLLKKSLVLLLSRHNDLQWRMSVLVQLLKLNWREAAKNREISKRAKEYSFLGATDGSYFATK